jgi:hypothetical protein
LGAAPGLWARTLFEELQEHYPGQFGPGQLRTLQRRVQQWRVVHGDDRTIELFFPQQHRPGEAAQTDFTHTGELGLTLRGEPYAPLLCHLVLPYSNWQWACRCRSESVLALNPQLTERDGRRVAATASAPRYRLYALAGGPPFRPGMVRVETQGAAIEVEVWSLPLSQLGSFMAGIPAPLGIGTVELADGSWEKGFICEPYALASARDITEFGGWRAYLAKAT